MVCMCEGIDYGLFRLEDEGVTMVTFNFHHKYAPKSKAVKKGQNIPNKPSLTHTTHLHSSLFHSMAVTHTRYLTYCWL